MRASVAAGTFAALLGAGLFGGGFALTAGATYDEPAHLAAGYTDLVLGRYRLNAMDHPPLAEMWAALPLLAARPDLFLGHPDWALARVYHYGDLFLQKNRLPARSLLARARLWNLLTLTALAGAAACAWAGRLGGAAAAVGAGAALGLCVPWTSNAALATTDGLSAALYFAACALLSVRPRGAGRWLAAGAACGAALAAKFNMIALPPVLAAAWAAERRVERGPSRREGAGPLLALVAAAAALAAAYRFESAGLYAKGLAATLARLSEGRGSYLLGRHSTGGWLAYFPAALLVKTPLAFLAAASVGLWALRARPRADWAWLLLPPGAYFAAAVSSKTQIGYRHILPLYPFLAVLAGLGFSALWARGRAGKAAAAGLAAWLVWAPASVHPHQLAYFNELAGGAAGGARWLADSNLDWGQDLPFLAEELRRRGNPAVVLCYFGTDDPAAYGIRYVPLAMVSNAERPGNAELRPGEPVWLAISETNRLAVYYRDKGLFAWLAARRPAAVPGWSMRLYDLTSDPEGRARVAELLAASGRSADARALRPAAGPGRPGA